MFEVAAEAAAANAEERKQDEREEGQRQRRIPVIGRRLEPGDESQPVGDQQKDEQRDGERPEVEISALQRILGQPSDVFDDQLDDVLKLRRSPDEQLASPDE